MIFAEIRADTTVNRTVYAVACGKFKECPFSADLLGKLRQGWARHLAEASGQAEPRLLEAPEGQPFLPHLLAAVLKACGDPDCRVMVEAKASAAKGVHLGHGCRLPWTPAVFEHKRAWRHYADDEDSFNPTLSNYWSAVDHVGDLEAQFAQEQAEGLIVERLDSEVRARYPAASVRVGTGA
jgi:hypothetical protein